MKLAHFITNQHERILAEWEAFARTLLPAAAGMPASELREPASGILEELVREIENEQSAEQRLVKSKGLLLSEHHIPSAAATHGALREVSGFTLLQVIAEYRALRSSILQLWLSQPGDLEQDASHQILRFNEAIDQALTEATESHAAQAASVRNASLLNLGHDLKTPLVAMAMAADYLTRPGVGTENTLKVGDRLKRSVAIMTPMVNQLLEYARLQPVQAAVDTEPGAATNCTSASEAEKSLSADIQ